ncbi:MAG: hypothetical protein QME42_01305 [bacterium]|nr:hypothetical protein [bacterium]
MPFDQEILHYLRDLTDFDISIDWLAVLNNQLELLKEWLQPFYYLPPYVYYRQLAAKSLKFQGIIHINFAVSVQVSGVRYQVSGIR